MATVGSILANVRLAFGDTDRDYITDTIGMEWLDVAQQRFCDEVMPLDEIQDITLTEKLTRYDLATNCLEVRGAMYYKSTTRKLNYEPPMEFDRILQGYRNQNPGTPTYYTVFRRQIVLGPQSPISNSATALASGDWASTATTIGLTAASGTFRNRGFLKNGTTGEVIEYLEIASTTVTGCVRGLHGTSAASVASGQTWTEVDLQVAYQKIPAALSATTASPEIPTPSHRYLEQYVLYLAWRNRGDLQKAEIAYNEFEELERRAKEKAGRRARENVRIKDRRYGTWGYLGE